MLIKRVPISVSRRSLTQLISIQSSVVSPIAMPPKRSASIATPPPPPKEDPTQPAMLRFQTHLPNLPVPPLAKTLDLYLTTIKPHLTPEQLETSTKVVKQFEQSEIAKTLQNRLENRAQNEGRDSWLSDWWNEAAYMGYRDPVVPYVNYFYTHRGTGGEDKTQARRAAELIRATEVFRDLTESQNLEPERVRVTPLCMDSYKNLFNASRIPTIPIDTSKKYPTAKGQNDHVIVLRRNRIFTVRVGGLGVQEIERLFQEVIDTVGDKEGPPVGLLTSQNRDIWADARDHLISIAPSNQDILEKIQSSILAVVLDDDHHATHAGGQSELEDRSWNLWVGKDGENRWFDKHQFIVTPSAHSGFNGEHSLLDGTPTLRMNEFVLASLAQGRIDLEPKGSAAWGENGRKPVELEWALDDKAQRDIKEAGKAHRELMGQHTMEGLHYEGYGKALIKKFKTSPDAWAQMVKHLAFYKLENRMGVCYESAQTRKFKLGRTEVIRSASQEAKEWIESMFRQGESDANRVALFRKAATRHLQYAALAADGQGVDRHLFGLKKLLKEGEQMPELFTDVAFGKTNHWEMSTSSLLSDYLDGWGYGEVVPDGYGLAYSVGDNFLRWIITARKDMKAKEYKECLIWACEEVRELMERAEGSAEQGKAKL
ncbi:Carnitine O-acyltransferase CRAT [Phaffia rhodozyma]|uniref:Carnitine O-acetyltransferase, mitochondrial n=1 Tax=Phaffia rhodozyma TaxID=264483 RepID=A0A0F7SSX3_PHARH|nr:Carnitine O-acyltransferase CRAT [Phaffia rhodozyma]